MQLIVQESNLLEIIMITILFVSVTNRGNATGIGIILITVK